MTKAPTTRTGDEMSGERWGVVDYDGNLKPGEWPSYEEAWQEGVCGRYLLSGLDVKRLEEWRA